MEELNVLQTSSVCSFYEIPTSGAPGIGRYIASTPETRDICNDPFVTGVQYTRSLSTACAAILKAFRKTSTFEMHEDDTTVLHILRGGLNFGLREALGDAFGWNVHPSAFISAQRARRSDNPEDWYITENAYEKVHLPPRGTIVFGDVVATGTSLLYALRRLVAVVEGERASIRSIVFLTIGAYRSEQVLAEIDAICREKFAGYEGAAVIYIEGRFDVATPQSQLSIKYTGTDLLRSQAKLAPEFLNSQYDDPAYPIERCTIYDAGSRAFYLPEYVEDVRDYWAKTLAMAQGGMSYEQLLAERFPELDGEKFRAPDLVELCERQIARCDALSTRRS